jgi:hypothetical protein
MIRSLLKNATLPQDWEKTSSILASFTASSTRSVLKILTKPHLLAIDHYQYPHYHR